MARNPSCSALLALPIFRSSCEKISPSPRPNQPEKRPASRGNTRPSGALGVHRARFCAVRSTVMGITVGRYALFEPFEAGGMATVHFGRLDGAGGFSRVVAIKRLLPHLLENHEFTEMLLKEARLAARVRHPNVAATLDVVATKGDVLLVLDYVHGEALSTLCRTQAKQKKEQVPLPIAIGIVLDMLQGLSAIHDATDEKGRSLSLVHRDISPPNVLVGADGVARVLDFGIATALEHIEETAPERRKGKRGYMSPEQLRGERLTQRSDVFSAGIVIWELLAM